MNHIVQIGFNQRIRLEWLERTSALLLAGNSKDEIQAALQDLLRDEISVGGNAERGNREKAITILMRTWVSVAKSLEPLRNDGLDHLRRLPASDHLPVHWGMAMAAYPFFGLVAESAGRLLALQGSVVASQVQRRVREQLGERETVRRATRRVLRCFFDWRVLEDTDKKGVYQASRIHQVSDTRLLGWIIEAALIASGVSSASLRAITGNPALFPFALGSTSARELEANARLEIYRQGLDEDMVRLRPSSR